MENEFKIGDKVLLNKPKDTITSELRWFPKMDKYDGKEFVVRDIWGRILKCVLNGGSIGWWIGKYFIPKSKVNESVETEEVDAEVKAEIAAELFTFTETLEEQLVADETAREEDELPSTELDVLVVPETARVFLTATAIFEVEDAV